MSRFVSVLSLALILSGCGINPDDIALSNQIEADVKRVARCDEMRANVQRINNYSANLVKEAKRLQMAWIIQEMQILKDEKKITENEWQTFLESTKPGVTAPRFPGSALDKLMKRVVSLGYIKPYLPQEVVTLGEEASKSPSGLTYELGFPECFSDFELQLKRKIAKSEKLKSIWGERIENPLDLLP